MSERIFSYIFWTLAIGLLFFLFLYKNLGGDIDNVLWRFIVTKVHLTHQLAMPYFTPTRCGGFHLAADAQDLIFSLYMPISFFITNIPWAIKITNLLLSIILSTGIYVWLPFLGITHRWARLFVSVLITLSGYWVYHLTQGGNIWCHGLAYTPWIMFYIEKIWSQKFELRRNYLRSVLILIFLFFLLINSGYYWLQVAVPLIMFRCLIELISGIPQGLKFSLGRLVVLGAIGAGAILLSLSRLGGIFEYQLSKFPRLGGEIGHFQIIGGKRWFELMTRSFFDQGIITKGQHSEYLGFFWDYTNFIGLVSLIALAIGISKSKELFKHKAFIALLLASWFQCALTQDSKVDDWVRGILPIYKQITWHWRGSIILVFLSGVWIALGYQKLLSSSRQILPKLAFMLMIVTLVELAFVHSSQVKALPNPTLKEIMIPSPEPQAPLKKYFAPCLLGYIYGYDHEHPEQLSVCGLDGGNVWDIKEGKFFNMHDVRVLGGSQANGGYYLKHQWPLWPISDRQDLEKFLNFQQIVEPSMSLRWMNFVAILSWIIFIVAALFILPKVGLKSIKNS